MIVIRPVAPFTMPALLEDSAGETPPRLIAPFPELFPAIRTITVFGRAVQGRP